MTAQTKEKYIRIVFIYIYVGVGYSLSVNKVRDIFNLDKENRSLLRYLKDLNECIKDEYAFHISRKGYIESKEGIDVPIDLFLKPKEEMENNALYNILYLFIKISNFYAELLFNSYWDEDEGIDWHNIDIKFLRNYFDKNPVDFLPPENELNDYFDIINSAMLKIEATGDF